MINSLRMVVTESAARGALEAYFHKVILGEYAFVS